MIETTEIDGCAAVTLHDDDGDLSATFLPGAGMVGLSLRDGERELLGARHGLADYVAKARTMGIPLLHPWANRLSRDRFPVAGIRGGEIEIRDDAAGLHRDPNGLPIHGLVAGLPDWTVERHDDGAGFAATLDFGAHPPLLASFPFPHTLRLDVTLRERTLRIAATVTATGVFPVPLAYGFHPYLQFDDVPRERWVVELPALRQLALDGRGIPTGATEQRPAQSAPLGERAFDDAFDQVPPGAVFAVAADGRRIEVCFEQGFPAAQVFAPTSEPVVCFEPMTAPTDALVSGEGLRLVPPGASDTSAFAIVVPPAA